MFDLALRHTKETLAKPICALIPSFMTPNALTILAFVCGLGSCLVQTLSTTDDRVPAAIGLWLLNRLLDSLDGSLARSRGVASELGGFIDLLCDFIVYSFLPISIAFQQRDSLSHVDWLAIAVLEASFHINNFVLFYAAAAAGKPKADEMTSVPMYPALVEGFESGLIFSAMLMWPEWVGHGSWIMSLAVGFGIVQRVQFLVSSLR
jgi:phosphatidylglycerophosphate synthase